MKRDLIQRNATVYPGWLESRMDNYTLLITSINWWKELETDAHLNSTWICILHPDSTNGNVGSRALVGKEVVVCWVGGSACWQNLDSGLGFHCGREWTLSSHLPVGSCTFPPQVTAVVNKGLRHFVGHFHVSGSLDGIFARLFYPSATWAFCYWCVNLFFL